VGKTTITLKSEIEGYVANRLQRALMQEASSMVAAGVCDWMDVELAVTKGPGFRWPIQGPVLHRHLGGGAGGVRHMIAHLGWRGDPSTRDSFIETVENRWGATPMDELEDWRDENMLALLRDLKEAP
jgi:carnitine 3-dehydrogenase